MTLISAHSGPGRKLVTLTERIRVCKRAPNKSSHLTRTVVSNVRLDESWSRRRDLNPRPTDYKSVALPTELRRLKWRLRHTSSMEFQSEAINQSHCGRLPLRLASRWRSTTCRQTRNANLTTVYPFPILAVRVLGAF